MNHGKASDEDDNAVAAPFSVIIPVHNESARIEGTLEALAVYMGTRLRRSEVMIIDDGSTDDTIDRCARFRSRPNLPFSLKLVQLARNWGKGRAIREGLKRAKGAHIAFMDADGSTALSAFDTFFSIDTSTEICIANRRHPKSTITHPQSIVRRCIGRFGVGFLRLVLHLPYHDTQCGFKIFTRDAARRCATLQTVNGFLFDAEILLIARLNGMHVIEIPVEWRSVPGSRVRLVRDGLRGFADLIRITVNRHCGKYMEYDGSSRE